MKNGILNCTNQIELPTSWNERKLQSKHQHSCYVHSGRYSGTDLYGSIITENRQFAVEDCQEQCAANDECNYYLYFTKDHYQR